MFIQELQLNLKSSTHLELHIILPALQSSHHSCHRTDTRVYVWPTKPVCGALSGFVLVPANPKAVFQASAVVASRVPNATIWVCAAAAASLAAWFAPQTLVNWSWILLVMMAGLSASSCPLLTTGSMAWKVDSVALRPLRPASNFCYMN